jgi:hypothetical protein
MAAYGGYKVISIDYRMPHDFPYSAVMDDAMAVWREAVKMQDPRRITIFGTSTGGGMSHVQYLFDPYAPETKEAFTEIARLFDKHLGK